MDVGNWESELIVFISAVAILEGSTSEHGPLGELQSIFAITGDFF